MKSIRKTLTRRLSITISLLVIVVLLAADIGVDTWVQREFNQGLKAKVGMLQSLVNEDLDGVEFEFAGEYFPEFEGASSPEYFQRKPPALSQTVGCETDTRSQSTGTRFTAEAVPPP